MYYKINLLRFKLTKTNFEVKQILAFPISYFPTLGVSLWFRVGTCGFLI